MYLIIFKNGSFVRTDSLARKEYKACIAGYCDLVNMGNYTFYSGSDSEWRKIDNIRDLY